MRNYYNDITLNNLAMISTLKEEIKVGGNVLYCTCTIIRVHKCPRPT